MLSEAKVSFGTDGKIFKQVTDIDKLKRAAFIAAYDQKSDDYKMLVEHRPTTHSEEMMKDFEVKGFPFVVIVESSGLVAWTGHPMDRDLNDDVNELMIDHVLFETEDFHDNPDASKRDPEEVELEKDLEKDLGQKKPKPFNEQVDLMKKKLEHFKTKMIEKMNVDTASSNKEGEIMFEVLKEKAKGLDRAYLVFDCFVRADLVEKDNPIVESKLTFNIIAQGEGGTKLDDQETVEDLEKSLGAFKDYVEKCISALKGTWRTKVTAEFEAEKVAKLEAKKAKDDAKEEEKKDGKTEQINTTKTEPAKTDDKKDDAEESDPDGENEEFALFERSKLGWYFRKLYIEHKYPDEVKEEEKKE